jgi:hypothetical protein
VNLSLLSMATGPAQPRHASTGADGDAVNANAQRFHHADDFIPRHDRMIERRQFAVDDVQIGAAYAARGHAQQHAAGAGMRLVSLHQPQWLAGTCEF